MKEITIIDVNEENYTNIINHVIDMFPNSHWIGSKAKLKPNSMTFKQIQKSHAALTDKNKSIDNTTFGLSITIDSFIFEKTTIELSYFTYKTGKFKEHPKEEIVFTANNFIKTNVLNLPLSRFI